MLKKPGPGGSREVLLSHGPEWNAMKRHGKYSQAPQETKFQVKATCILYRNGRLSKSSLAQKGTIIINHVFSEAKKLWLNVHSSSCILLLFSVLCQFPALDGVGSVVAFEQRRSHSRPLSSPSQP